MSAPGKQYKVRLASGRVLGPLDLEQIRAFIRKGQITGVEIAREHPDGEWLDINLFDPIAAMLIGKAEGKLTRMDIRKIQPQSSFPDQGATHILSGTTATLPLPPDEQEISKTEI